MDTEATAPTDTNGAVAASAAPETAAAPAQPTPVAATPPTFPPIVAAPQASSNGRNTPTPSSMPPFSAATAELIARARASAAANSNGTPADREAEARAALMKTMTMSNALPVPVSASSGVTKRGGRGGRRSRGGNGAVDGRSPSEGSPMVASAATPTTTAGTPGERGKGRGGRPRGRGRGGGRGGKRKRSESVDSEDLQLTDSSKSDPDDGNASDISASYTPLPKVTKSGRSINKPTQYVPTIPEPTSQPNKKKRPYTRRNLDAAVCKLCHRPTSPSNNQIVFCDGCGGGYHQYCHDPVIERGVVEVAEKEWFCAECVRQRQSPEKGDEEGCVSGEGLTMDEKRARLTQLPQERLITLLLRASSLQPTLPLFPTAASLAPSSKPTNNNDTPAVIDEPYDGYDTDPPAHYPKPGNGLARTLRPEAEDLEWLVDENEDVFSHQVRPLDVGMGGT